MQFYENFVRLSAQKGKSLAQVARDVGVQKSTVSRWANGSEPRDTTLIRIADYFGVTTKELLGAEPMPETKVEEPIKQKETGLAAALEALRDQPGRRMLLAATSGMSEAQVEKVAAFLAEIRGGDKD